MGWRQPNWDEWLDLKTIKAVVRHASGVITVLVLFALTGWIIDASVSDDDWKKVLKTIDYVVMTGLFLWLIYQMGCVLWHERDKK